MRAKSMPRSWGGTLLGAACVAILLSASTATASPLDLFGFGGRSPGMAGTGVALSTGYDSVYLNPAGLADVCCKRLTLGAGYNITESIGLKFEYYNYLDSGTKEPWFDDSGAIFQLTAAF